MNLFVLWLFISVKIYDERQIDNEFTNVKTIHFTKNIFKRKYNFTCQNATVSVKIQKYLKLFHMI